MEIMLLFLFFAVTDGKWHNLDEKIMRGMDLILYG
jgi:hypothetical protein